MKAFYANPRPLLSLSKPPPPTHTPLHSLSPPEHLLPGPVPLSTLFCQQPGAQQQRQQGSTDLPASSVYSRIVPDVLYGIFVTL